MPGEPPDHRINGQITRASGGIIEKGITHG